MGSPEGAQTHMWPLSKARTRQGLFGGARSSNGPYEGVKNRQQLQEKERIGIGLQEGTWPSMGAYAGARSRQGLEEGGRFSVWPLPGTTVKLGPYEGSLGDRKTVGYQTGATNRFGPQVRPRNSVRQLSVPWSSLGQQEARYSSPSSLRQISGQQSSLTQLAGQQSSLRQLSGQQSSLRQLAGQQSSLRQLAGHQSSLGQLAGSDTRGSLGSFAWQDDGSLGAQAGAGSSLGAESWSSLAPLALAGNKVARDKGFLDTQGPPEGTRGVAAPGWQYNRLNSTQREQKSNCLTVDKKGCSCGPKNPEDTLDRIIGGSLSSWHPWVALLIKGDMCGQAGEGREHGYCTATLISKKHVLTAAHCLGYYLFKQHGFEMYDKSLIEVSGDHSDNNYEKGI